MSIATSRLPDLESCPTRAVIINVSTKVFSTLALLSTLEHAKVPTVLVDCESTDGSLEHFAALRERFDFDLVSAPLRPHGQTLDLLFGQLDDDRLLLVDSDLEIHDDRIIRFCNTFIDDEQTFGCGFVNGPGWLGDHTGTHLEGAYYQERMWIPLTLLKSTPVRQALAAGRTFEASTQHNAIGGAPRLSRMIGSARDRSAAAARMADHVLPRRLRDSYYGHRPATVMWDTGAEIFQYLRYERELVFAGLPEHYHDRYVTHFFGTTRSALGEVNVHDEGTQYDDNLSLATRRLSERYGVVPDGIRAT